MESLPQEIVLNILSRLPVLSLVQSKSVCQAWRSLIQDPVLWQKRFCCALENNPSFILQSNHPIQSQLYLGDLSCQNDGVNMMITKKLPMPPLDRFSLAGSCNGLLLLLDYHRSFEPCIYNPFTENYQDLPDIISRRHNSRVFGFGFDRTTKKYKVVEVSCTIYTCGSLGQACPPFEASVHIITIGSPTWRNLGTVPFHLMWQESENLVNGKLHWVSRPKRNTTANFIISFDMATEKFQEVPLPDCSSSSGLALEGFNQVVVLHGCLSAVCYEADSEELEIWVMKEYGLKQSWSKEFSIGAYVPKTLLEHGGPESFQNSRNYLHRKCTTVVCLLRSGEMLLQYRNRALAVYNPHCKTIKDLQLTFEGIPTFFNLVAHVASLNWVDTFIHMASC